MSAGSDESVEDRIVQAIEDRTPLCDVAVDPTVKDGIFVITRPSAFFTVATAPVPKDVAEMAAESGVVWMHQGGDLGDDFVVMRSGEFLDMLTEEP